MGRGRRHVVQSQTNKGDCLPRSYRLACVRGRQGASPASSLEPRPNRERAKFALGYEDFPSSRPKPRTLSVLSLAGGIRQAKPAVKSGGSVNDVHRRQCGCIAQSSTRSANLTFSRPMPLSFFRINLKPQTNSHARFRSRHSQGSTNSS